MLYILKKKKNLQWPNLQRIWGNEEEAFVPLVAARRRVWEEELCCACDLCLCSARLNGLVLASLCEIILVLMIVINKNTSKAVTFLGCSFAQTSFAHQFYISTLIEMGGY